MPESNGHIISGGFTGKIYNMDNTLCEKFLAKIPNVNYEQTILAGWEYYSFTSDIPLNGNDERYYYNENYDGSPFINELLCCRAIGHLLIFTRGKREYNYFLEHILNKGSIALELKSCFISVDSFVKIGAKEKDYSLTSISAFYRGIGDSLKSIRFFGEDVTSSDLFKNNIDEIKIYRCGIKELSQVDEMISIGTDGSLYFRYEYQNLQKINNLFKFLKDGYLK